MYEFVQRQDKAVADALAGEEARQATGLELIPSENYVSRAVREATGSALTNKYAEGYPGARYYGGQEFTDAVELLAIDRAKQLFGAKFANVQPHSGADANLAVYFALLTPGDTVLGMDLSHGGHLTHGHPVTHAAKLFRFVGYKMKDVATGEIDYAAVRALAVEHKPKIILAGYSAYSRNLDWAQFAAIAKEVGAVAVADIAHIAGLIAGGALPNPFDAGFDIMTSTTHKTLRGPRGGLILVRDSEELAKKIDKSVFPGLQGGPMMHTIAAKAVAFGEALQPGFKTYAAQVLTNAKAMEATFAARNVRIIGGGTDNHLLLLDVSSFGLSGKEAQELLDTLGLTLNKNVIADDTRGAMDPSGIRLGTPALTTRGLKEGECARVAELVCDALAHKQDLGALDAIRTEVRAIAATFPIPESFV